MIWSKAVATHTEPQRKHRIVLQPYTLKAIPTSNSRALESGSTNQKQRSKKAGAFDFESREKKEGLQKAAENELTLLRELQKQKFKDFKADPEAANAACYQQPACTGQARQEEATWWNPFTWFGGGSKNDNESDGRPRIKGMKDIPKPAQGGG